MDRERMIAAILARAKIMTKEELRLLLLIADKLHKA